LKVAIFDYGAGNIFSLKNSLEKNGAQVDIITSLDKSKELIVIAGALVNKEREIPDYIQMDEKNKIAKLIRIPKFSEVPYPTIMEPNLVVEYYSR